MSNLKSLRDELAALRQAIETTGVGSAEVFGERKADLRRLAQAVALLIGRAALDDGDTSGRRLMPQQRTNARKLRKLAPDEVGRRCVMELERATA